MLESAVVGAAVTSEFVDLLEDRPTCARAAEDNEDLRPELICTRLRFDRESVLVSRCIVEIVRDFGSVCSRV